MEGGGVLNRIAFNIWVMGILIASSVHQHAHAYEIGTHARVTQKIFQYSSINASGWLEDRFGFSKESMLGGSFAENERYYLDITGDQIYARRSSSYALENMPTFSAVSSENARNPFTENPLDDPYGDIFRVTNHFYDPVWDRPLTLTPLDELGEKAPNWALGTTDFLADPAPDNPGRRNHFTIPDAREALYRAVTGQSSIGNKAIYPDGNGTGIEPPTPAAAEQMRKAYWATTFRALGDVLHLLEDMSQPQCTLANNLHRYLATVLFISDAVQGSHHV